MILVFGTVCFLLCFPKAKCVTFIILEKFWCTFKWTTHHAIPLIYNEIYNFVNLVTYEDK